MRGKPKYDYCDIVTFKCDGEIKEGIVVIIDRYGTFFDSSDVSYDLLVDADKCLYKHFREDYLIEKLGKSEETIEQICKRL